MKRPVYLLLTATVCLGITVSAQNTWRGKRLAPLRTTGTETPTPMQPCDSSVVSASGFEKPLRSNIESLFLTNHSADTLGRVLLHVEYIDANGRQLHSRDEYLDLELPPQSTRKVELRSFDRQGVFYYQLSTRPRTRANATPFKVRLRVDSISSSSN